VLALGFRRFVIIATGYVRHNATQRRDELALGMTSFESLQGYGGASLRAARLSATQLTRVKLGGVWSSSLSSYAATAS
jgi:hypothetical protein